METTSQISTKLASQEHGYRDYDILDRPDIKRACVPFKIKEGDSFNVYFHNGRKMGCIWNKDLQTSLQKFIKSL